MTRPRKQTVDYFPHSCRHGKTMLVLEQKYGNDGYAFWFKMLEILGISEGHYIDCNDPAAWFYLLSSTRCTDGKATEILNLLSDLGAIDKEVWLEKIIWSQNFVDGIADAYSRRKVDIPTKEDIKFEFPVVDEEYYRKMRCRSATTRAIRSGVLKKEPCVVCGNTEVEAHHPPEYDDPLNVTWLCSEHHKCQHNGRLTGINVNINPAQRDKRGVGEDIYPQTKLDETKLDETKLKDIPPKPPKKSRSKTPETPLPENFGISDGVRTWAAEKGFTRLDDHLESFRDYALSRAKTYADWDAAFKRAIREDWAKLGDNGRLMVRRQQPISKADQVTLGNLAARERVLKKLEGVG